MSDFNIDLLDYTTSPPVEKILNLMISRNYYPVITRPTLLFGGTMRHAVAGCNERPRPLRGTIRHAVAGCNERLRPLQGLNASCSGRV